MAESNKDTGKKLNTSAKPGGLLPPKENKANASGKSKGLIDELESKLDDLFALDDKDTKDIETRQVIKSPLDGVKESPIDPIAAAPDKDKAEKIKTEAPAPPLAPAKKAAVPPKPKLTPPAGVDSRETTVQKPKAAAIKTSRPAPGSTPDSNAAKTPPLKPAAPTTEKSEMKPVAKAVSDQTEQKALKLGSFQPIHSAQTADMRKEPDSPKPAKAEAVDKQKTKITPPDTLQIKEPQPPKAAAEKKPDDRPNTAKDQKEKPILSKTKQAPLPEKASPAKGRQDSLPAKPVALKKEPEKTGPQKDLTKHTALKLALAGIVLVGGVIALLIFFRTPDLSPRIETAAAPPAHKINKPPATAPEAKTTPTAIKSVSDQPAPPAVQPAARPVAAPVEEKLPEPPASPAATTADEIMEFLQGWKTAWENSAGEKGDTDAFMSFYSEDFSSNGLDKNNWRRDKAEKNRKKEWIRIKLDRIHIVGPPESGRYEARFIQVYESSNYADTSNQVLVLKKDASGWKITTINPQTQTSYPYSIHDGSYRTLPSAREAVEAYRKMGLEAYWTPVDLEGKGAWYRVYIGYYADLSSALKAIEAKALNDVRPEETRYAMRIGAYGSKDELERQRRFVVESGYVPYVITDGNGNLNLYVGAFVTSKNAEKFSAELNLKGITSLVVER
ncbi:MAG: SPOR domain-containing protein [Thermodesulfobacteriota bacterium]